MDIDHPEDFIRIYDNAVSSQFCRGIIDYFEWCLANNKTWDRTESTKLKKDDKSTALNPRDFWDINFANEHLGGYIEEFNDSFWNECYKDYVREFDALSSFDRHSIFTYKVQKTIPSGGYHVWHCEHGTRQFSGRVSTYILYLNDISEGGETEFLYQRKRVAPLERRLVIFPAGYTHTHRGNPPLRGTKYIMTGWIELC